jgi:hypothetical protein
MSLVKISVFAGARDDVLEDCWINPEMVTHVARTPNRDRDDAVPRSAQSIIGFYYRIGVAYSPLSPSEVVSVLFPTSKPEPEAAREDFYKTATLQLTTELDVLLNAIDDLASDSAGVAGLHRNGDIAPWETLLQGGEFEQWLGGQMASARAVLDRLEKENDYG